MPRPKNNDYPTYMRPDGDRGGFFVQNPLTGKRKRFRADQEADARKTAELLNEYVEKQRQKKLLDAGRAMLNWVIDRVIVEVVPLQPWDESTRTTALQRLNRIKRELGRDEVGDDVPIESIDSVKIGTWLKKTAPRADPFNKWRSILVLIWTFAVAEGIVPTNEAEKIAPRSISRKIESNRKRRQPLDVEGFQAVHAQAGELLKLAMEISLVTLQSRNEVCNLTHTDFRDGWVYIIRDKTSGDSDMAFIRVALTPELESFQARARRLWQEPLDESTVPICEQAKALAQQGVPVAQIADQLKSTPKKIRQLLWWARRRDRAHNVPVVSPYVIHRRPARRQQRWIKGKPHWTFVKPRYLTRLFAKARDKVPRFAALPERERPTFHEIRGLGSRLARDRGMRKAEISALMTHSNKNTTEIYLQGGREALSDEHFVPVAAPFSVGQLIGG